MLGNNVIRKPKPEENGLLSVVPREESLTCFTSSRTASRHWEWPSCRMFSFDLARCRGVRPALSRASTRAPVGTGRRKHAGHENERRQEEVEEGTTYLLGAAW